jgi:hypothetical protein
VTTDARRQPPPNRSGLSHETARREAIGASAEEPVTQDLYIEIAGGIEKQRWMLLARLAQPSSTRTGGG